MTPYKHDERKNLQSKIIKKQTPCIIAPKEEKHRKPRKRKIVTPRLNGVHFEKQVYEENFAVHQSRATNLWTTLARFSLSFEGQM